MRFFNTAGPVRCDKHYCLLPLERFDLKEILNLINQEKYFVLHAPRQTGKTTCLLALMDYLNKAGEYRALYINVEAAQAAREDVAEGMIQAMALGKPKEKYILSAVNIPFVEIYRKIIRLRERIYPHTYRIPKIVKLPKILKGVCTGAAAFSKDEFINPYIVAAAFHYKYYTHRKAQEHLRFSPDLLLEEPIMDEIYGRIRNE